MPGAGTIHSALALLAAAAPFAAARLDSGMRFALPRYFLAFRAIDIAGTANPRRESFDAIVQRMRNEEWLALEDDFRTPAVSHVAAKLPQFNL
jgi:hypothetical protein